MSEATHELRAEELRALGVAAGDVAPASCEALRLRALRGARTLRRARDGMAR